MMEVDRKDSGISTATNFSEPDYKPSGGTDVDKENLADNLGSLSLNAEVKAKGEAGGDKKDQKIIKTWSLKDFEIGRPLGKVCIAL